MRVCGQGAHGKPGKGAGDPKKKCEFRTMEVREYISLY